MKKRTEEPLSIDQIRQKKQSLIKAINDNALILSGNTEDHNEHLIGNVPRDILENVYHHLDQNLDDKYFRLRYSKPWSYLFGLDSIVDVHVTFPDQAAVRSSIYEEIRAEQQIQFSKFKFVKGYSSVSALYSDFHNYKLALIPLGFSVDLDNHEKTITIQLMV